MKKQRETLVGIDEVGRGPLAGPVAVCALILRERKRRILRGIKDSKQLDEAGREAWYKKLRGYEKEGLLSFKVAFVSERTIDGKGIPHSLLRAVGSCLRRLKVSKRAKVLLDGSLYAPDIYLRQRTVIRGDERHAVIAAASICAKVRRDRRMKSFGKKYPAYLFESHKGYGTKAHYLALRKHGPCEIHRHSFLKKLKFAPVLK
ncbi:ribonuclease HII [Candidatus Parcubacteria bacterium]|nr:ribonuclease HII [Candidatus Parcubacteria bacterium]